MKRVMAGLYLFSLVCAAVVLICSFKTLVILLLVLASIIGILALVLSVLYAAYVLDTGKLP